MPQGSPRHTEPPRPQDLDLDSFFAQQGTLPGAIQARLDRMVKAAAITDSDVERARQSRYEACVVERILRHSGLQLPHWRILERDCERLTGSPRLTCKWLNQTYPEFPCRLGAAKIRRAHETTLQDFLQSWTKLKVFETYLDWLLDLGLDELSLDPLEPEHYAATLFCFEMGSLGTMALHTYIRRHDAPHRVLPATYLTKVLRKPAGVFHLEPLTTLLQAIGPWGKSQTHP